MTSFSWDDASAAFTSGLTAIGMNYHTEVLAPDVQGNITYALVPEKVTRGPHFGTWMLSVNKASQNKEWAYRAKLVHQRPDPDQDAGCAAPRAASRSTRQRRPTRTRRSSGTSTTSWANRSRSASAARD